MSKAFTKEDSDGEDALPPYRPPWPSGTRNYVTAAGYERARLQRIALSEEVAAAGASASQELRRRLEIATVHADAAEIVTAAPGVDRVQFGVDVVVRGEGGVRRYAIVGVDEVDAARGHVSWLSPIARALQGARVGDGVTVRSPGGEEELEVVSIAPVAVTRA